MTVLVKDWHWRWLLGMGLANWLQSLVLPQYCCSVYFRKNGSLGDFYSLLVVDWSVTQVFDCRRGYIWRRPWGCILCGNVLGSVTGKTETVGGIKSNQVKRLNYIHCFNVSWKVATNWKLLLVVQFFAIKSCGVVLIWGRQGESPSLPSSFGYVPVFIMLLFQSYF